MIKKRILTFLTITLILAACNAGAAPAPTIDVNAINTAALATAMAQISAQQTQTALAAPTNTPLPTDTPASLATAELPTAGPSPTGNAGALPTISFNSTPGANTTPLAGFTQVSGSPAAPAAPAGPTTSLGDACNNNTFVTDVTIPDGTIFAGDNNKGDRPGDQFEKIWRVQNTGSCKWDEGYKLAFVGGDKDLDPYTFEFKDSKDFVDPGETADLGVLLTAPKKIGKYTATWRMQSDNGSFFGTPLTVVIEVKE